MIDPEPGLAIVFNGCIYNFRELRRELQGKGYRFFSTGDTEVILKAYHAWGPRCVERFLGMFFAIAERNSSRVMLARDRLGIKPMYLAQNGKVLRFASTPPALLAAGSIDTEIDPAALHHYMSFHAVVPAPMTILKGVRKLPPATIRMIEPNGEWRDETYWSLPPPPRAEADDAMDEAAVVAADRRRSAARGRRAGGRAALGRPRQLAPRRTVRQRRGRQQRSCKAARAPTRSSAAIIGIHGCCAPTTRSPSMRASISTATMTRWARRWRRAS